MATQALGENRMTDDRLRAAALQATIWQVIEQRAKELKDQAKAELATGLEAGDAVAGRWNGHTVGKATMTTGRTKLAVTDERALLEWVKEHHPTEIVEVVNPSYVKSLERTTFNGVVVDDQGELVAGVEQVVGEPYVSVRRDPDAAAVVAELFASGLVALDGIKELQT